VIVHENVALGPLTTMQVGGLGRYFIEAASLDEVIQAWEFARSKQLPLFVLGGGSNLLVADSGWPGMVLKVAIPGIKQTPRPDDVLFEAGAGEQWDRFVSHAVIVGCAGVECLSGIPGSVGGTPVQNVGAYGQEVSQTIESVRAVDRESGKICDFSRTECEFGYRSSRFNGRERDRYIVVQVSFALRKNGAARVEYADLQRYFSGRSHPPTLAETREAVRQIRASKGMLLIPGDSDCRSAGSFFKNPVVSDSEFGELAARATARGLEIPSYPGLAAQRKVSAAWLVEHSGFSKGYRQGHAGISSKHALALVNLGGASASEVIALKDEIQRRVEELWGVRLQPEPVLVGF
jgi:UDP-N-acetylmuramate dehydrogenase